MHTGWVSLSSPQVPLVFANIEKQGRRCNISSMGYRGATIPSFRQKKVLARISAIKSDIVIVLVGGNDLGTTFAPLPQSVWFSFCLFAD